MSVCNPCQRVKNIYTCATSIVIGSVSEPEEGYLLYFQASSTGKIITIPVESDIDGLITLFDIPEFLANTDYKVWLTLNPPAAANDTVPFLIEDVEYECVVVRFDRVYDLENITVTELEQMFVLA